MWYKEISSVIFLFSFHSHKWSPCFPAQAAATPSPGRSKTWAVCFLASEAQAWYSWVSRGLTIFLCPLLRQAFSCFPETVWCWISCYLPWGSSSAVNLRLERVCLPPELQVLTSGIGNFLWPDSCLGYPTGKPWKQTLWKHPFNLRRICSGLWINFVRNSVFKGPVSVLLLSPLNS